MFRDSLYEGNMKISAIKCEMNAVKDSIEGIVGAGKIRMTRQIANLDYANDKCGRKSDGVLCRLE